jgi:membrane associated rhomboid family serine protease
MRPFVRGSAIQVEICSACHGIYLDRGELAAIGQLAQSRLLEPRPAEAVANHTTAVERHYARETPWELDNADWWRQFAIGLPAELNWPPLRRPLVNMALIIINAIASVWFIHALYGSQPRAALAWAFDPAAPTWVTAIVAAFIHMGPVHLLGNMWMLWLFGDNVEDYLGHLGYLAFYAGGIAAAWLVHGLAGGGPAIGASGAVSAVMGAYLIACPWARISVMLLWIQIPIAYPFWLFIWVLYHIFAISFGMTGIAFWAHLGGLAYGIVVFGVYRDVAFRRRTT